MSSNVGILSEQQIAGAINGKPFREINRNLQTMLRMIFPDLSDDSVVSAFQLNSIYKPDIELKFNGKTRYISVKTNHANEVHGEFIDSLMNFLETKGISKETIDTLRLVHYGDGTTNGTGSKRYNTFDTTLKYHDRMIKANKELNASHQLMFDLINRVMIQGIDPNAKKIDYIYFGTVDYGNLVSMNQIYAYITRKSWDHFNCLHIGPIFFKPKARYVDSQIVSEYRRRLCVCYWPNLGDDLGYMSRRYTFKSI